MKVMDLFRLDGKVAIVTGGGSGIGKAITEGLVEAGANVVIASRKFEVLEKTAKELSNHSSRVVPVKCDLGKNGRHKQPSRRNPKRIQRHPHPRQQFRNILGNALPRIFRGKMGLNNEN
ncbi:MAG: SDR family NAD(P)-dependent oxidoreductase [Candidatus Freyarchaeota archaeon]|nr:SDR family NAD(P)-dependent oxidoreductase [Candidatus Jordarchaeia archaeon]MBS7279380.1 SDR family NAD(P)-dependent oxidoreductase [Candidatus Jordarchaeia archaeon]